MTADADIPEEQKAAQLVERLVGFLAECRAVRRRFAAPSASETSSGQAEREFSVALLDSIEAGLVGLTDGHARDHAMARARNAVFAATGGGPVLSVSTTPVERQPLLLRGALRIEGGSAC